MISVIITSYKEPRTIGKAIKPFLKLKDKEIIVVAPDQETLEQAKKYQINTIKDLGKGKPAALNLAIKRAKGKILILTDGDVYSQKVSYLLSPFIDSNVGAVCGRPISVNKRSNILGFWSHLLTDAAHKTRLSRKNKYIDCSGYLFAVRKKALEKIPESILVDDAYISKLVHKKGYKIIYEPNSKVFVKYPLTLKDWYMQKIRSTAGYYQLKKYFIKGSDMRTFSKELLEGVFLALRYPKTLREFYWTASLFFARLYLWIRIFILFNFQKKKLKTVWKRVESTK